MIGSGHTTLPLMIRECVDKRGWADSEEMVDIIAVAQSLPGVLSVNIAVAIGGKRRGFLGSFAAVAGVALPAAIAMTVIAAFSARLYEYKAVNAAFAGMRPAAAGLVAAAVITLFKPSVKTAWQFIIAAGCFVMIMAGLPAPYSILICGASAVAVGFIKKKIAK